MSHTVVVHDHQAYTQLLSMHNGDINQLDNAAKIQVELVRGTNKVACVTCSYDYLYRPPELARLCPALMTMLYYKQPRSTPFNDGDQPNNNNNSSHLPFHPDHSQHLTHHLMRRLRPALLRFISDPPVMPAETAPAAELEAWAGYCVADFTAYTPDSLPQGPYLPLASQWAASLGLPHLTRAPVTENRPSDDQPSPQPSPTVGDDAPQPPSHFPPSTAPLTSGPYNLHGNGSKYKKFQATTTPT
jgi:hypothetical protein